MKLFDDICTNGGFGRTLTFSQVADMTIDQILYITSGDEGEIEDSTSYDEVLRLADIAKRKEKKKRG